MCGGAGLGLEQCDRLAQPLPILLRTWNAENATLTDSLKYVTLRLPRSIASHIFLCSSLWEIAKNDPAPTHEWQTGDGLGYQHVLCILLYRYVDVRRRCVHSSYLHSLEHLKDSAAGAIIKDAEKRLKIPIPRA